jgi:5-methylthioadenosine/S-adenosylhomocysteine deaminase
LADCAQVAGKHKIHLQIHGSETEQEVQQAQASFNRTPIELMDEVGLLGEATIVAHAVHVGDRDVRRLQESGTAVAHNIASNLKLASGIAPIHRYLDAGICVGVGTDGPGSNDGLDLLRDLKYASLMQKVITADATSVPADTALAMVTSEGARALGLEKEIGSLEVGKRADVILIDLDRPHLTPHHAAYPSNITSHLVYSAAGADVATVIVDGQMLMRDRVPLTLNPASVQRAAQLSSERLLKRAGLL